MSDHHARRERAALLLKIETPGVRARLIGALGDFDLAADACRSAGAHVPEAAAPG